MIGAWLRHARLDAWRHMCASPYTSNTLLMLPCSYPRTGLVGHPGTFDRKPGMPAPTGKDAGPKVWLCHIERPRTPPGDDRRPGFRVKRLWMTH